MTAPAQLTLPLDGPAADSTTAPPPGHHRYEENRNGKVVCRRCTVERRQAPVGRRKGFTVQWRVLQDGKWVWTTACPPCIEPEKKTPSGRPRRPRKGPSTEGQVGMALTDKPS